jgi:hypothetical protein
MAVQRQFFFRLSVPLAPIPRLSQGLKTEKVWEGLDHVPIAGRCEMAALTSQGRRCRKDLKEEIAVLVCPEDEIEGEGLTFS